MTHYPVEHVNLLNLLPVFTFLNKLILWKLWIRFAFALELISPSDESFFHIFGCVRSFPSPNHSFEERHKSGGKIYILFLGGTTSDLCSLKGDRNLRLLECFFLAGRRSLG